MVGGIGILDDSLVLRGEALLKRRYTPLKRDVVHDFRILHFRLLW